MDREKDLEAMYLAAVRQLQTIVFEINYSTGNRYNSPMLQEIFGIDEVRSENFLEDTKTKSIVYEEDYELYKTLFDLREGERAVTCRFICKDGNVEWFRVTLQYELDDKKDVFRVIGTMKNVSQEIRASANLSYRQNFDSLTGAMNFDRFCEECSACIQQENIQKSAIIVFDINKFKLINDLHGMRTGDLILIHVADTIRENLAVSEMFCRMHSDEFALCIHYDTKGNIIRFIERLRKNIRNNNLGVDVKTSYGIYLPNDETDIPVNLMCDRASLAKDAIKDKVTQFCAFFDEEYRNKMVKNSEIEAEMEQALKENQFKMYLQPKYSLETRSIVGAEVLSRWQHPTKGMIQPNDFIPLFEKNGFIIKLDEYMWEQACKALSQWKRQGRRVIPISINVSRYHIYNNHIEGLLKQLLQQYDLEPGDLSLEITETLFFNDGQQLNHLLNRLQGMGFNLEIDDFGAGYSSLNMLRTIPVNCIKIDKAFLDDTLASERGKIVVRHTIAMAKELNLKIIAEGVETQDHVQFLKASNCDCAQGYFFARPMPLEEFNQLNF